MVALFAYRCARHVAYSGIVTNAWFASRGMIAGCNLATTLVKVYCIIPFDKVCALSPEATLDVFIDDLTGSSTGSPDVVEKALVDCAHQLHQAVQQDLKCQNPQQ